MDDGKERKAVHLLPSGQSGPSGRPVLRPPERLDNRGEPVPSCVLGRSIHGIGKPRHGHVGDGILIHHEKVGGLEIVLDNLRPHHGHGRLRFGELALDQPVYVFSSVDREGADAGFVIHIEGRIGGTDIGGNLFQVDLQPVRVPGNGQYRFQAERLASPDLLPQVLPLPGDEHGVEGKGFDSTEAGQIHAVGTDRESILKQSRRSVSLRSFPTLPSKGTIGDKTGFGQPEASPPIVVYEVEGVVGRFSRVTHMKPDRLEGLREPVIVDVERLSPEADAWIQPVGPGIPVQEACKKVFLPGIAPGKGRIPET